MVKSDNEPQYDTMRGIGNEVFTAKKRGGTSLCFLEIKFFSRP